MCLLSTVVDKLDLVGTSIICLLFSENRYQGLELLVCTFVIATSTLHRIQLSEWIIFLEASQN